jgi:hypothetical protein
MLMDDIKKNCNFKERPKTKITIKKNEDRIWYKNKMTWCLSISARLAWNSKKKMSSGLTTA